MTKDSPLFTKTYDFLVYVMNIVDKFPRHQRAAVGRRIQTLSWDFLDTILAARKCSREERPRLLNHADLTLDRLRYTLRLCRDIELLSQKQYGQSAGLLTEMGRLLGKWIQRYNPR